MSLSVRLCVASHGGCQEEETELATEATQHEANELVPAAGLSDDHSLHPHDGSGQLQELS